MTIAESITSVALELLLVGAAVAIGVPLLMLLVRVVRGEFAPRRLKERYREGKEEVEE